MTRNVLLALLAVAFGGCATGYQKQGLTGGYSERRISDSAYYVSFSGNGFASKDRVHWFWMYRCAEVTVQQKHSLFVLNTGNRSSRAVSEVPRLRPAAYHASDGGQFVTTAATYVPIYVPGPGAIQTFSAAATVLMYDRPLPNEVVEAWDAQAVRDALNTYIKSNGKDGVPNSDELMHHALVAHDDIGVREIAGVGAPEGVAVSLDGKPLRTSASIRETLEGYSVRAALRAGYRAAFATNSMERVKASATWDITISPNGPVIDCRLVDETLSNAKLVEDITSFLRRLNFGAKDVGTTRAQGVKIEFQPLD